MKKPQPYIIKGRAVISVIAHVPHGSTYIPNDVRRTIVLSDRGLKRELILMTDSYTPELFSSILNLGGIMIINNYSRLVIDPERFEDEKKEIMASRGMGVIYTKTAEGKRLREKLTPKAQNGLIVKYFRPYHMTIEKKVSWLLKKFGRCFIIDCHSFSSKPLPYELNQRTKRPDICIGTDPFHTPKSVISTIKTFCRKNNIAIALNKPFAGTYVPLKFFQKDRRVSSVMIEINRSLYMNEKTGLPLISFSNFQKLLSELMAQLVYQKK